MSIPDFFRHRPRARKPRNWPSWLVQDDPNPQPSHLDELDGLGEFPGLSQEDIDRLRIGRVQEPTGEVLNRLMGALAEVPNDSSATVEEHADQMISTVRPALRAPDRLGTRWDVVFAAECGIDLNGEVSR